MDNFLSLFLYHFWGFLGSIKHMYMVAQSYFENYTDSLIILFSPYYILSGGTVNNNHGINGFKKDLNMNSSTMIINDRKQWIMRRNSF